MEYNVYMNDTVFFFMTSEVGLDKLFITTGSYTANSSHPYISPPTPDLLQSGGRGGYDQDPGRAFR